MVKIPLPNKRKLEGSGAFDRGILTWAVVSWACRLEAEALAFVTEPGMMNKATAINKMLNGIISKFFICPWLSFWFILNLSSAYVYDVANSVPKYAKIEKNRKKYITY